MPAVSVASVIAKLPDPNAAIRLIERIRTEDRERLARLRDRTATVNRLKDRRAIFLRDRKYLDGYANSWFVRQTTVGYAPATKNSNEELQLKEFVVDKSALDKVHAELKLNAEQIELAMSGATVPALTAKRIEETLLALPATATFAPYVTTPTLADGETKADALARVRASISDALAERKSIANKTPTADEIKRAWHSQLARLAKRGTPTIGPDAVEFASQPLPKTAGVPLFNSVTDALALVAFLFRDELAARVDSLIVDSGNSMPAADKAERITAIESEVVMLRRDEAALVEGIIADGGVAWHAPDAPVEAVLSISVT